jgi:tmRNA-binding protein
MYFSFLTFLFYLMFVHIAFVFRTSSMKRKEIRKRKLMSDQRTLKALTSASRFMFISALFKEL